MTKALLHGGPLDDSWWRIDGDPPRYLIPQDGLGTPEPVLIADFPVPAGGWRYELQTRDDGRTVYVWSRDERPAMEFVAVFQGGLANGYRMDVLGLTEPWPYVRLAHRPDFEHGGHMEWIHIPWPDMAPWPDEVTYELTGTLIPPRGGTAEAFYVPTEAPPWVRIERIAP